MSGEIHPPSDAAPARAAPEPARAAGRTGWGVAAIAGIVLLAGIESASALIAPRMAPTDEDWRAAAQEVRAGFRPGDLIVAAPIWSDPVMRLHLGDLVPVKMAARMDAARYARVWEISQRGGVSDDVQDLPLAHEGRHGALKLRRYDRAPSAVTFDFVDEWAKARVLRQEPGRGDIPCDRLVDKHQCPHLGFNFVKPALLEIDTTLRQALYAQPVEGARVIVEYADVPLGRELAVGSGLHHVWMRKLGDGKVTLRVLVDGKEVARETATNRSGWTIRRIDTASRAGKTATVRFEIQADRSFARHFGFAAEARS